MVAKVIGAVFGILEIQGNTFLSAMNHAAFGIRRRGRCLLAA